MKIKNALLWGAAGLVAVSAGASFAATATGSSALSGFAGKMGFGTHRAASDVTRTVANVDGGVVVTLSATGADAISALQKREVSRPSRAVEQTANGVKVTITSTDAAVAKQLQDSQGRMGKGAMGDRQGGKMGRGDKGPRSGFGSGAMMDFSSIKRTVANVDNGVTVTMTSDKAEVATALQNGPAGQAKGMNADDKIAVTKENVTGGIKMTITSADAATVKLIQEREASRPQAGMAGKAGFAKGGMMGKGGRGMGRSGSGVQAPAAQ